MNWFTNYSTVNEGLPSIWTYSLAISGDYIFAGTKSGTWRRPLSQIITGIYDSKANAHAGFSLDQNYPNPFNPVTTISFSILNSSYVSLKIFDDLGKDVRTLVNGVKPSGNYQIEFDASALPSGVYYFRLQSGAFAETKKLILLR